MNSGRAVVLERVTKRYGDGPRAAAALTDVSLAIDAGEFVALAGPSGSGKSTLLNLIAGLDAPSSGRVVVAGRDLGSLSDDERSDLRLRHVGFVFQTFNLFPTLTARENVAWPLGFLGLRWWQALERAADMLSAAGIEAAARDRLPGELSGGEQQRVAIARALATGPSIVLADEPTGNLDSKTAEAILELLAGLRARRQATVVLVTHNEAAARRASRIVHLADGRVIDDIAQDRGSGLSRWPAA